MKLQPLFNTVFLSFSLLFSGTQSLLLHAQVLVDPNAPSSQKPTVLVAPNGTPLINIQTPSAAGVSRNSYQQLDVNSQGAILNNSRTQVQTQLGGWVQGNPWLNQNEARIILNEVNSSNPSHLNGFIEVAGQRAEVIIANPSGISVNGAGFINASSATLTTGQVIYQNNTLNSLDVTGGRIVIQGDGLNNSQVDYTKLLAKAVEVNAGIWAKDLNIGVGNAVYALDGQEAATSTASTQTNTQTTPKFLLDVSELGGMYAGKITLVGTEAGVGVNNAGYIGATAGNIELTMDGKIVNKGQIMASSDAEPSAQPSVQINANELANDGGTIYAGNRIDISTKNNVSNLNEGLISAEKTLEIQADNLYSDEKSAYLANDIQFKASRSIHSHGYHIATNNVSMQAADIDLSHSINAARQIKLQAQDKDIVLSEAIISAEIFSAQAAAEMHTDKADIRADKITIDAQFLNNEAGNIEQYGEDQLNLDVQNGLNNKDGSLFSQGNLAISAAYIHNTQGQLASAQSLSLHTDELTNTGSIYAEDQLDIQAGSLDNTGVLYAKTGNLTAVVQHTLTNASDIAAGSHLNLVAEHIQLQENSALSAGLQDGAQGNLVLTAKQTLNAQGDILANQDMTVQANDIHFHSNADAYAQNIVIEAQTVNNHGTLAADHALMLSAQQLTNHLDANIFSADESHLNITQGLTNYGLLDGRLNHIVADTLVNMGTGRIYGNHLAIQAQQFENRAEQITEADGTQKTLSAGTLAARERMDIGVATLRNENGAYIFSEGQLNVGGSLNQDLQATGKAISITNSASTIESLASMRLMTNNLYNQNPTFDLKDKAPTIQEMTLIQAKGSNEKIDINDLVREKYSKTYHYRIKGEAPLAYGEYGKAPIPTYRECISETSSEQEDCPNGAFHPDSDYTPEHAIWKELGLTPPDVEPSVLEQPQAPAEIEGVCEVPASESCVAFNNAKIAYQSDLILYEASVAQHNEWVEETTKRTDALSDAINIYNAQFMKGYIGDSTEHNIVRTTIEQEIDESLNNPGRILAKGNLHIEGDGELINDKSEIIVGNNLTGSVGRIVNTSVAALIKYKDVGTSQYSDITWHGGFRRYHHRHYEDAVNYSLPWQKKVNLTVSKQETNAQYQSSSAEIQQSVKDEQLNISEVKPSAPDFIGFDTDLVIRTQAPAFNLPSASIYRQNPQPDAQFLIETDPAFANYKTWLSSDYIFEQLEFNADEYQKRFADGFYEQRLIREQINQLTGQYFLNDYSDEEEQYQALMQAGVQFAKTYDLIPGVALTSEQMARLTTDIVWLTSQNVVLNDGTVQQVLVPQLYALVGANTASGQLGAIAARQIDFTVAGDVENSGSIFAKEQLGIKAQSIYNNGGRLQAKVLGLEAEEDIINLGGSIYADDSLSLKAQRDIRFETTVSKSESVGMVRSIIDRVAGIFIGKNASGGLLIDAGNNFEMVGAEIHNASEQTLQMNAGNDILVGSLALQQQEHLQFDRKNYSNYDELTYHGSSINSQGGLSFNAGNNATFQSAQINSASDIEVTAQNIAITAQVDSKQLDQQSYSKSSSRKITEKNGFIKQSASDSSFNGENIKLNATGTVAITGSKLNATNDLAIGEVVMKQQADGSFKPVSGDNAPNNLVVDTLELHNENWHERSVEKRGMAKTLTQVAAVAGALMLPTLAPGLDMPEMSLGESSSQRTISTTHQGSELNAGNNMVLAAKESVHVTSGNINAGGTAAVISNDVTFDAAVNTHITETSHSQSTVKGLGMSLSKDEVTLGGMQKTQQTDTERTTTTTHQGTQINAGNLVVMAENDATFVASQVNVQNDAVVQAGNDLNIEGRADSTTTETYSKTDTTTVTAGVKNAYVDTALAADAVVKAGEDLKRAERALRDAEQRVKDGTLAPSALDDYKINLAAASTQLAQATLNLTASGATAAASTGTLGFYATGKAEKTTTEQQSANTTQSYQGSSFNVGGNASFDAGNLMNIVGSGIAVKENLTMNAERINITAGIQENTRHSSSQTKTVGVTASTGASGSVGLNASQSKNEADSYSKTHINSNINAGSLTSTSDQFTLQGANVEIVGDVQLNTEQLTVASVQDEYRSQSKGSSQSVGISGGSSGVTGGSIGAGKNSGSEESKWVNNTTTFIGGGAMNVTADKTTITGGIIANASRDENGQLQDHGKLNLVTNELVINDLQDYNKSDSKGFNANVNAGWAEGSGNQKGHLTGSTTIGVQKGGHVKEQTTFATIGGGTVTKKDGTAVNTDGINRDLNETQIITKDQQTAGLDATVTVDHRLLSKGGQASIKEDFTKSNMLVDTAVLIASTERVGVTDFFDEVGKKHTTYEGIKSEIANNPELAKQLQNADLNPAEKEAMLNQLTHRVMKDLGYDTTDYQNIIVDKSDSIRSGFYSEETGNSYINDGLINNTKGLVSVAGHEASHAMDARSDTSYSKEDNETYANQFGKNFGNYTNTALGVTGNGSMASGNNHVGNSSQEVKNQTNAYNALDKSKGDSYLTPEQQKQYNNALKGCQGNNRCEYDVARTYQSLDDKQEVERQLAKVQQIYQNAVDGAGAIIDAVTSPIETAKHLKEAITGLNANTLNQMADSQHQMLLDRDAAYIAGDSEALGKAEGNIATENLAALSIPGGAGAAAKLTDVAGDVVNTGKVVKKSDHPIFGKSTGDYSAIEVGSLTENLAETFSGGRYTTYVLERDTVLYRVGDANQPLGQFFSIEPPTSVIQTRIDKAVLPVWPNGSTSPLNTSFAVKIPAGTSIHVGEIGSQGGMYIGGTQQIVIPKPWTIDGVQVINKSPIK